MRESRENISEHDMRKKFKKKIKLTAIRGKTNKAKNKNKEIPKKQNAVKCKSSCD